MRISEKDLFHLAMYDCASVLSIKDEAEQEFRGIRLAKACGMSWDELKQIYKKHDLRATATYIEKNIHLLDIELFPILVEIFEDDEEEES